MQEKMGPAVDKKEPVVVKKYANRRLYNTETSTYVTLDDLAAMVKGERDFVVFDAKTGDDLTHSVLTQIIVEQESRMGSETLLPIPFLRQLIRFYGDSIQKMVPSYLQVSMESLTREQDRYRKQFASAFTPVGAIELYQEQARKNLAMFEQAMSMFTPFGPTAGSKSTMPPKANEAPRAPAQPTGEPPKPAVQAATQGAATQAPALPQAVKGDDLAELKAQLASMSAKIEKLSRDRG
jgi:polyhydroxyalkanoate synthesis repressor PhaR